MDRMSNFDRPHMTRRHLFHLAGAGVTMGWLAQRVSAQAGSCQVVANVTTQNTAKNVVFILLTGAPSNIDTFDYKQTPDTPLNLLKPESVNGITWPSGLFPKLGAQLGDIAIIRTLRAWALVHSLAQTWTQIGRNPAAALGNIAPNIGSIVAFEKEMERQPGQVFPTFLALNAPSGVGCGYLPSLYAPFHVQPAVNGIPDTKNPDDPTGQGVLQQRFLALDTIDHNLRTNAPYGPELADMDTFYQAARGMMYNPAVTKAFSYTAADSARYGSSGVGNALLVAKQVLEADQGTRFVQVAFGSWDHHQLIYSPQNLPKMSQQLDEGLSAFLADLMSSGMLSDTLVVMCGEFGRTVGPLTSAKGRDHAPQQWAMFAGAGVTGGKIIGSTDPTGGMTADPGWSRNRDVKPEDLEATIYSAMGINWTKVCYNDPFGRGFEYVPFSSQDLYGPVNELWS